MPLTAGNVSIFVLLESTTANSTTTYLEMTVPQRENMPISTTGSFRASLLGLLRYCFPHGPIRIKNIFHDTEGNLQDHEFLTGM